MLRPLPAQRMPIYTFKSPRVNVDYHIEYKSLTAQERKWLKGRRQAVEPAIGHLKSDNRMGRC